MFGKNVEGLSVNEIDGKTVITAPRGVVYLSEFMNTLPNGILNKRKQDVVQPQLYWKILKM